MATAPTPTPAPAPTTPPAPTGPAPDALPVQYPDPVTGDPDRPTK